MSLQRQIVESRIRNRDQIEQAKENGNTSLVFGLLIVGGLLFAGHSMLTQMHHFHRSMKDIFRSLVSRNAIRQVGKELAKDDIQKVAESTGNALGMNHDKQNER